MTPETLTFTGAISHGQTVCLTFPTAQVVEFVERQTGKTIHDIRPMFMARNEPEEWRYLARLMRDRWIEPDDLIGTAVMDGIIARIDAAEKA